MGLKNPRNKELRAIAEDFDLHIIYAFGSQAKEVLERIKGNVLIRILWMRINGQGHGIKKL